MAGNCEGTEGQEAYLGLHYLINEWQYPLSIECLRTSSVFDSPMVITSRSFTCKIAVWNSGSGSAILKCWIQRFWEGTAVMNPALNGSEPVDLQDVTPKPAAEMRTLWQRALNPAAEGSKPHGRGLGSPRRGLRTPQRVLQTPTKLALNPSTSCSTQMFNTKKLFFSQYSLVMMWKCRNTLTK